MRLRALGYWLWALGFAVPISGAANAQVADTVPRTATDSALVRARQLAREGRDADGRRVVDSVLARLTPDSSRYGEVLYLRGSLAPTAADAEKDYRRLLVEAPFSPRAEDALLQLAQLEQARGDRRGASDHLQRYLLSYPQGAARPRVSVQLVRLLFDQGPQQLARACDALKNARMDVPTSNVELRNQLDANAPRCAYVENVAQPVDSAAAAEAAAATGAPPVDTTRPAAPPTIPASPPAVTPPIPSTTTAVPPTQVTTAPPVVAPQPVLVAAPTQAPAPAAFYSVQLAAYAAQETATRMVQQLIARGIDARVDGDKAPYRVRVGKYQTRADAVKASTDLKAKGHTGFITLVSPTAK